jgi:shikimate kinase
MTAGKSHVGKALAVRTGLHFRDVDALIVEQEGRSISEIFQMFGEPYFRAVETEILRDLCRQYGQVISCGGGTILSATNRKLLTDCCETVWLRVSESSVLSRLRSKGAQKRPLLQEMEPEETVRHLLAQREPFYAQADHFVETDGRKVADVAREIAARLGLPPLDRNRGGSTGEM